MIADVLEPFDDAMADLYVARTGREKQAIVELMDAESYFVGEAAVRQGFADTLLPLDAVKETPTGKDTMNTTDEAVRSERERCAAILALPEAKGREAAAQAAVAHGLTVEAAKAVLSAAPKKSSLDDAMRGRSPGISSEDTPDQHTEHQHKIADDFGFRSGIFAKAGKPH
jgi:hypothetical protein